MSERGLPHGAGDRYRWLAPAVSIFAAIVAFAGAWLRPVWHDELYTLALARLPVDSLLSALVIDSGPPLHYLICHGLFMLVGWQEGSLLGTVMVRLPSVLAFAFIPWVVWRARPIDGRAGLWGTMLVVSWLPLFYFGTEARAYALLALVNALLWIRGAEWIERGGRWVCVFVVLAGCLPMLHYTGAVSLLFLPALAFFLSPERRRTLWFALAGSALPLALWSPIVLRAPQASMGWLATTAGPGRPGTSSISVLAPAGPFPGLFELSAAPVPNWVSMLALAILVGGGLTGFSYLRRQPDVDQDRLTDAARLTIALVPAVVLGLVALAGVPLYFAGRTESLVWALAAALTAHLITGLPPVARRVAAGPYVVIGLATIAMWLGALSARPPAAGIEVGLALAPMTEEGDRVVVAGLWQLEVRHGLARGVSEESGAPSWIPEVETVPGSQADHPGWLDREGVTSPDLLDEARDLAAISAAEQRRIWLIRSPVLPLDQNFFPAFAGWQRAQVAGSPIISVDLLVPPPRGLSVGPDGGAGS